MRVNIVLGQSIANSLVNTSGNHINIINNEQQRAFNIQGHQLRRAIQNIRGREPNDVLSEAQRIRRFLLICIRDITGMKFRPIVIFLMHACWK